MADKKPLPERITEALRAHGPCTYEQLAKHADTTVGSLYTMGGTLKKIGVQKTKEDGVTLLAVGDAPKPTRRAAPKAKKEKREPKPPRCAAPRTPRPANGDARFAMEEDGQLGIVKGDKQIRLGSAEFERLRAFITRTEPVWKGARA